MSVRRIDPAMLVVAGGVAAALHVGKLPTALPVLRDALGVTLVQAGFLLSLVQFAGMLLGLPVGLGADTLGLKRTMAGGLLLLSLASAAGAFAHDAGTLMLLRAVEGLGFLLASMPAPGLIRRLVEPSRVNAALGIWGAYMPVGTALALVAGAPVMHFVTWRGWWALLALIAFAMAALLWTLLPADPPRHAPVSPSRPWVERSRQTLQSRGPWLVALSFAVYSAQWLSVIGFLPTMYAQAGLAPSSAGTATALAALVNMVGNVAAGRLLQTGVAAPQLLRAGFTAMAIGALVAFGDADLPASLRYAGVLLFSMVGGLVPATLFSLAVGLAPGESTISTTVGWMQQWSAIGQFAGPPAVAFVASSVGGWQWSGAVTGGCAVTGFLFAGFIGNAIARARIMSAPDQQHLPEMSSSDDVYVRDTRRWLERAVIGLNLCPFAKAVHVKGLVHYAVSAATETSQLLADVRAELDALVAVDPEVRETTLLIVPRCLQHFLDFNEFLGQAERTLRRRGLDGVIQIASFHPHFRFEGTEEDDITNFTNRSPHPVIHLLREASIDRAVEAFPHPESIYEANMETLRRIGRAGWDALDVGPSR